MTKKKRRGDANGGGNDAADDGGWRADPRFGHLATDPRYRSASTRKAARVQVDARFKAMFTDPDFTTSVRSDKRGRPVAMSSRQDLRQFYGLAKDEAEGDEEEEGSEEGEDDDNEEEGEEEEQADDNVEQDEEEEETDGDSDSEEGVGHGDDDEAAEGKESSSEDEEFHALQRTAVADAEAAGAGAALASDVAATSRLAVTQQDWEQLKVTDLYMLLCSHCPAAEGRLQSVTVYPSRFGLRRMAAEATSGPLELAAAAAGKKPATDYSRRLRRHQLKRLWYYYAVAEFDCVGAAAAVYEQCSGLEIESTGGCLRLSYVPDGMQFGGEDDVPAEWRHLITRCSGLDPAAYKPCKFVTASLGRTHVGLTWDETPAERTKYLQGLFAKPEFDEDDPDLKRLSEFLAMSSDDEDAEENAGRRGGDNARRLRAALLGESDDTAAASEAAAADASGAGGGATFSDDELPDDVASGLDSVSAAAGAAAAGPAAESHKRSRRRRLKAQAKRAKLAKAGLLPADGGGSSADEDAEEPEEFGGKFGGASASEQELALLVADRSAVEGSAKGRVTAADVASDGRFGALFTDPSFHVDPTHSEAAKAAEVQRLIVSAKKRAAMGLDT